MPPQSSAEAGSWPPLTPANSTRPDVEMVLNGPQQQIPTQHTSTAQSTCCASSQRSTIPSPNSMGIKMTNFLAEQARSFQTRFAEAELILSRFCNLLESVTDDKLRQAVELNGMALQGQITEILWGHPSNPHATAPAQAASGKTDRSHAAPSSEPAPKPLASNTHPVRILAREAARSVASKPSSTSAGPSYEQLPDLTTTQSPERP